MIIMKHLAIIQAEFLKIAIAFRSQTAFNQYKRDHPNADMSNHSVIRESIGTERRESDRTAILTPDRGWVRCDNDDDGRKDLEEERAKIQSFLENVRE